MTRILLLEDEPTYDSHFEKTFGEGAVDSFRSVEEVVAALKTSIGWNYAFLDFDLGQKSSKTGLSAFALLKEHSPLTKLIGFTNVGENSRTLFAVAAYRWFNMRGLLHKSDATSARLQAIAQGRDLMPNEEWRTSLLRESWRVDELFPHKRFGPLWREVTAARAQPLALSRRVPGEPESFARKTFVPRATAAAAAFSEVFLPTLNLNDEKPQPTLIEFVRQNYTFFSAPDLLEILEIVRPWNRRSLRGE